MTDIAIPGGASDAPLFFLALGEGGLVIGVAQSNVEQHGMLLVDRDIHAAAQCRIYRCRLINGALVDFEPPPLPAVAPDNPTLSDWRVGLRLWGRLDDVKARVDALIASTDPANVMLGEIARERLEYANNVLRAQLMALQGALGFSSDEIEESLWRADRVRQGDLSGVWPLA